MLYSRGPQLRGQEPGCTAGDEQQASRRSFICIYSPSPSQPLLPELHLLSDPWQPQILLGVRTCAFKFEHYFSTTNDSQTGKEWIHKPIVNKPGESPSSTLEEEQLFEIADSGGHKSMSETTSNLHTFWIQLKALYPEIVTKALKSLLPFLTPCLCKAGFSAVTATKTRLWTRLDISDTLQVSLSHHPQVGPSRGPSRSLGGIRAPTGFALWRVV